MNTQDFDIKLNEENVITDSMKDETKIEESEKIDMKDGDLQINDVASKDK